MNNRKAFFKRSARAGYIDRTGFSIVDLSVALVVVSVLAALVMPVVQTMARAFFV